MTSEELKKGFKVYAIENARLIQDLPQSIINVAYSRQLVRSSSSPGTNYRSALRGRSTADFINKLKVVEEELDETVCFLELIQEFNPKLKERITVLIKEGNELLAITVASIKTSRSRISS